MPPTSPLAPPVAPLIHISSPFRRSNALIVRPSLTTVIVLLVDEVSPPPLEYVHARMSNPYFIVQHNKAN